ncbi:hypothetical protein VP01_2536g2 [Puccinia sorghi]|uniref:THO complex subunit 2 N-terminal domain-containing protein n=1 Tax=Puccinia sorghi TaxID=27349 RepID=A0A0L6V768_9BASI|nr:hypothetical protein VP01_2536g2 [Puccinia sorghi]
MEPGVQAIVPQRFKATRQPILTFDQFFPAGETSQIRDSRIEKVSNNIKAMIGFFDLDPNRSLDITLFWLTCYQLTHILSLFQPMCQIFRGQCRKYSTVIKILYPPPLPLPKPAVTSTRKPPSTNAPLPPLVSRHKSNSKLPSIPSHPMNNVPYRKGIDPEHHALVADGPKSQFLTTHPPSTEAAEREVLAWAAVQRFRKFAAANQPINNLLPCLLGLEAPFPWALPDSMDRAGDTLQSPIIHLARQHGHEPPNVSLLLQGDSMVADPDEKNKESELDVSSIFNFSPAPRSANLAYHLLIRTWPKHTGSPICPNSSASYNESHSIIPPCFSAGMVMQSPHKPLVATMGYVKDLALSQGSNKGLVHISQETMD